MRKNEECFERWMLTDRSFCFHSLVGILHLDRRNDKIWSQRKIGKTRILWENSGFSARDAPHTTRCDTSCPSDCRWFVTAFESPGEETVNAFCQNFCIETVSGPTAAKCMMTSVSIVCESWCWPWQMMKGRKENLEHLSPVVHHLQQVRLIVGIELCMLFQQRFQRSHFHEKKEIHRWQLTMVNFAFCSNALIVIQPRFGLITCLAH